MKTGEIIKQVDVIRAEVSPDNSNFDSVLSMLERVRCLVCQVETGEKSEAVLVSVPGHLKSARALIRLGE